MANRQRWEDLGRLLLRITIGGRMLVHGIAKVRHGVEGIGHMLAAHGVPTFVAYGVYVGEVVAPALVLIGLLTRPAAVVVAFQMVVAVSLAHTAQLFSLEPRSGGYALELQALY